MLQGFNTPAVEHGALVVTASRLGYENPLANTNAGRISDVIIIEICRDIELPLPI